jgi:hypothetical protein
MIDMIHISILAFIACLAAAASVSSVFTLFFLCCFILSKKADESNKKYSEDEDDLDVYM